MYKIDHEFDDTIQKIAQQEDELVFDEFNAQIAFELGSALINKAKKNNVVYSINISLNRKQLFHYSMDGASPDNDNWLRRKENTVYHFFKSSMRVALEFRRNNWDFYPQFDLRPEDFANSGGSFPIIINGVGVVGAVTISGLPEEVDHQYVVEVLTEYIKNKK